MNAKVTRERFHQLLNRSIAYTFIVFLLLCGIAILGQVLDYKTTVKAASLEELKVELQASQADREAARQAIAHYEASVVMAQNRKVGEAIASLEASMKAVPTATARETLALLYQQVGDQPRAMRLAEDAVRSAREHGTAVEKAKAARLLDTVRVTRPHVTSACPADAGLIGPKIDLPGGGEDFENATPLVPCIYSGVADISGGAWQFFKLSVPQGRTLRVVMRLRSNNAEATWIRLHGPDGGSLTEPHYAFQESSITGPLEYKADAAETIYVALKGGVRGTAFDFGVR